MSMTSLRTLFITAMACACLAPTAQAFAADPLPSWNDGAAKKSIVAFVATALRRSVSAWWYSSRSSER